MSHPHSLTSLSPREDITDALNRALVGCDRNDPSIFDSAFAGEDVTVESIDGEKRTINGFSAIKEQLFGHVGPMDTTHMISNVRVDYTEGASTASLTCYAMTQRCPPGKGRDPDAPKFTTGGEYLVDLVKDEADGLWKIKKWALDTIWKQGDASIM